MNVLSLIFAYLPSTGGAQRSVYNLSRELARRGHSVAIAANGVRLRYSTAEPTPLLSLPIPTAIRRNARERTSGAVRDAVNLPALAALCMRRSIDVVHCHLINMDTRYAVLLKRLLGVKVVITLRGGELCHWIEGRPARRAYVQRMLESADAVTALSRSQFADAQAITSKLPNGPVVIPNPADPTAIRAAADEIKPHGGSPYVLFTGRLESPKNVDSLIRAYARLIAEHPDFPCDLVIAGDGSEGPALQQIAERAGRRVRFLGDLDYVRSLALIRDARMLVLPSRTGEGCPNVVLEAMALGTPVVVSDHEPLREMVEHAVRGEVFTLGSEAALGVALLRVGTERDLRGKYIEAAGKYVRQRHRFDAVVPAYEEIYATLAGHRAGMPLTRFQTSKPDRA